MAEHVRVVSNWDQLFDAASNLCLIESFVERFDRDGRARDLEALDLFAGEGNFKKECEKLNVNAEGIDILTDKLNHDILTHRGFTYILQAVLRLVSRLLI